MHIKKLKILLLALAVAILPLAGGKNVFAEENEEITSTEDLMSYQGVVENENGTVNEEKSVINVVKEDREGPTLEGVQFDKESYNMGETIKVTVKANDDVSGLKSVTLTIYNPNNENVITDWGTTFDENGVANCSFDLNEYAMSGTWIIRYIHLHDNAGNSSTYNCDKDFNGYFTVNENINEDREGPSLQKVEFDKGAYNAGETVNVKVKAEDDVSGLKSVTLTIYNPNNENVITDWGTTFDENGVANCSFDLNEYAMSGTWIIRYIHLHDNAGNSSTYNCDKDFDGNFYVGYDNSPVIIAEDRVIKLGEEINMLDGVIAEDEEDGDITSKIEVNGAVDNSKVGSYKVTYIVEDSHGNTAEKTTNVRVIYCFEGILSPINSNGSSIYKLGKTIPVKFKVKDVSNNYIDNAVAQLSYQRIDIGGQSVINIENSFRYDKEEQQYIYNLSTKKGFEKGKYAINITLDDGEEYSIEFELR